MVRDIVGVSTALLFLAGGALPLRAAELCERQQRGGGAPQRPSQEQSSDRPAPHPYKWWVDGRAELGISDQQAASVEQIWQSSVTKLRAQREQLDQLEAVLSKMILEGADESAVSSQVDRVEGVRSELNKGRTLMLYRMNRQLTPEQRTKLKAMHDRYEASRKK
ncbi:MAG: hypothetical protein DMF86_15025 [Acidobacteria bacterium]|nr:MAG: hypothetical protein DMF86_15025 [Acidobacteriota bacterium]